MYYNPETKEQKNLNDLKIMFNSSIPDTIEQINGWYLLYTQDISISNTQRKVLGDIQLIDGHYTQTYKIEDIPQEEIDLIEKRNKKIELERELERYNYVYVEIVLGLATKEDYKEEIDNIARIHNELFALE